MQYKIRKAQLADAKGIAKVHIQSWRETYRGIVADEYLKNLSLTKRIRRWQEMLSKPTKESWTFVSEDTKSRVVAFASAGRSRDMDNKKFKGELYAIYILKKHQGAGLGFRLVKKLCSTLTKYGMNNMFVAVLKDNTSKNFYTKLGAQLFKTAKIKIGKQKLVEEYYGWKNLKHFV
jgi:L-amino acid N-acyltransferase YncA